jgi:3-oxoadipate enol-lactonase
MPFAKLGEIELCFERGGRGQRLLYISGTGGDLRQKPGVLDGPWPKHFEVMAFDQRGMGRSSKPDIPYAMADYADDAAALMDSQGWDEALVIGVSFGGMVAQELVLRHPHKVSKLVLACTSPGGAGGASYPLHTIPPMSPEDRAKFMIPLLDARCDAAWAAAHPAEYAQLVALNAANPFAHEPGHAVGAARQIEARSGHDTWDRLPQVRCPVLVTGGLYDAVALPETQRRLADHIPGAQVRLFEGGHLFMLQDREALPAIIGFLEG